MHTDYTTATRWSLAQAVSLAAVALLASAIIAANAFRYTPYQGPNASALIVMDRWTGCLEVNAVVRGTLVEKRLCPGRGITW